MRLIAPENWVPIEIDGLEPAAVVAVRDLSSGIIVAGPGAGKTELLAQRACFLFQTGLCPAPKRILAISFKRDAASNLRRRVRKRCGHETARRFDSMTYDSFAKSLVDRFLAGLPAGFRPTENYGIELDLDRALKMRQVLGAAGAVVPSLAEAIIRSGAEEAFFDRLIVGQKLVELSATASEQERLAAEVWRVLLFGGSASRLNFTMMGRLRGGTTDAHVLCQQVGGERMSHSANDSAVSKRSAACRPCRVRQTAFVVAAAVIFLTCPPKNPCGFALADGDQPASDPKAKEPARSPHNQQPFPDFGFPPPMDQFEGALFTLSQDYPTEPIVDKKPDFLSIPFNENKEKQNWLEYLLAVRRYCFEGNIEVDWDVRKNAVRKWYHAPWQHAGPKGREGIRGLTREATSQPGQLAPTQTDKFQTYAVAFYNDIGAVTIGHVWRDHLNPDTNDIRFDVGTVVFKLLFTQATADQVPYLRPPVEWTAFAEVSDKDRNRKIQKLRLLQMDIMVRDERMERINGTGWVFGTYCYNGKVKSENPYERLVPVGLQWGNDPTIDKDTVNQKPQQTLPNNELTETVINASADLPPQHLGWNGRLNGPADYYASSCMSCHSTAQYPVSRYQNPDFGTRKVKRGSEEWMRWFRNLECGKPFSEKSNSTDYSLQLTIGIQNFHHWRDSQGGYFAKKIELPIEVKRGKD